jgi:hypothetical protein
MSSRPEPAPERAPSAAGPPPPEDPAPDTEPPAAIRQAHAAFRRDLGRLLDERPGQWVAYRGAERIGVAPTKAALYQECLRRGLRRGEFLVRSIEPEAGEVVMGPGSPEADASGRDG